MLFATKSVNSMMGSGTLTIVLEELVVSKIQMRRLSTTECRWREAKVLSIICHLLFRSCR